MPSPLGYTPMNDMSCIENNTISNKAHFSVK